MERRNETVYGIWNTSAGGNSSPAMSGTTIFDTEKIPKSDKTPEDRIKKKERHILERYDIFQRVHIHLKC